MRGNTFGKLFSLTSFGESHGEALGVVIDGMPSEMLINLQDLQAWLDRRRPGRLKVSTSRSESDQAQILSGVFENQTLGTPICVIVKNENQKSDDYNKIKNNPRPGHADQTTLDKFGIRDYRGGGRASGRETLSRVIAGYFASLIIPNVKVYAKISRLAHFEAKTGDITKTSTLGFLDQGQEDSIEKFLLDCKAKGESAGGEILVHIEGVPSGLGEPVFDKLKADLAKAITSIGSCMGIVFGQGVDFITTPGSIVSQKSSNFGGIEGGISNGDKIIFRSIFKAPSTVGENAKEGRHDPCILPRVLPVIESMCYITLADHFLRQNAYIKKA